MITSIDKVDRQDDFYPSSFREEIIKDLNAKLIKEALLKLSKFKSSFANCTLVSISREFEAGERNVIRTRVELKFLYFTNLWSY